jgi:hypothetical protein
VCFISANAKKDASQDKLADKLYAFVLDTNSKKKVLYAPSELERDEWIDVVRKYSAQSNIENAYEIPRDANSKLGEGSGFDWSGIV